MTGLQPLLELDRHEHAHLTCLVNVQLGDLICLQFFAVDPQPETDVGGGGCSSVRYGHARLNALETLGLASAGGHLDYDLGTAELGVKLPDLSPPPQGQRETNRSDGHSDDPDDYPDVHQAGLPDLVAAKLAAIDLPGGPGTYSR
jgi:hypothetical protein